MAVATPAAGAGRRGETVRQKREREQELLVWPDLVFVEFISALLFTISFVILSTFVNAPLLNIANPDVTPNPSKAPWYFMNLQELLLHMDPGLAGVIVPTILLIGLMAIPYIDRSNEGQGGWFATANSVRITAFSAIYAFVLVMWLIFWDDGAHVRAYERLPGLIGRDDQLTWPGDYGRMFWQDWPGGDFVRNFFWDFIFLENRVAMRDQWSWSIGGFNWPEDIRDVPVPGNGTWLLHWGEPTWMPGWLRALYPYDAHLDIPSITVEYIVPIIAMTLLPILLVVIVFKLGWAATTRDAMIALFTGFIVVYFVLTAIGVAFRGAGQALMPFWQVPNLEGDPAIERYVPARDLPHYALIDTNNEAERMRYG